MTYIITLGSRQIPVTIVKTDRKSISLGVRNGAFTARAPFFVSDAVVEDFIERNREWIENQLRRIEEEQKEHVDLLHMPDRPLTSREIRNIKDAFADRVAYWAGQMHVSYGNITIRNQKTRWGSCSSSGNLNFQYKLYFMPHTLMDYVIIHELAHRIHMNHSRDFWALVAIYCPNYKACRTELKKYS